MPSYVDPEREQFEAFKRMPRHKPVAMLNLLRFREVAAYPSDHPLTGNASSGAEAYRRYGMESGPIFQSVGGTIVWSAKPEAVLIGPPDERWDAVFVALYPSVEAFLQMVTDPSYRLAVVHRQAAVATSRLIRTQPSDARAGFA